MLSIYSSVLDECLIVFSLENGWKFLVMYLVRNYDSDVEQVWEEKVFRVTTLTTKILTKHQGSFQLVTFHVREMRKLAKHVFVKLFNPVKKLSSPVAKNISKTFRLRFIWKKSVWEHSEGEKTSVWRYSRGELSGDKLSGVKTPRLQHWEVKFWNSRIPRSVC